MMRIRLLTVLFFYLLLTFSLSAQPRFDSIPLNQSWRFRQSGTTDWMPASVPGCVHTDLLNAGKIGDPYYRLNEQQMQWIDKVNWEYRTSFVITAENLGYQHAELVFEGLDTYADVYLNGALIISADNMFVPWKADVKHWLKEGPNELRIYFTSPVIRGLQKQEELGYPLPASNDQSENGGMGPNKVSIFTRKAPFHFGWDWGPRLVTSGIWRPVYLRTWDEARICDLSLIQKNLNRTEADLVAAVTIESSVEKKYAIQLFVNNTIALSTTLEVKPGVADYPLQFTIANPQLWWPNGLGSQTLYPVTALLSDDALPLGSKTRLIGLRTIRLIRKPDARGGGESFYFEVNGRPVFAKGANYIPNDVFLPRVSPQKYEFIVQSAAEAHLNMLRVWGGGIYENDLFYDLCDKYGIMVWQDFMFACSMYPGDKDFLNNVTFEATENVKRLRNHACMALWCGNNEIENAWAEGHDDRGWGWKELYDSAQRKTIWKAYDTLFHHILPSVVAAYGNQLPYWHSSPSAGMGKLAGYDSNSGDMHYWGVWHGQEPFSDFRRYRARFMSEYGFQSFPEFNSVRNYTLPEDWNIGSEVMTSHQRSGIGNLRILQYMRQHYRVPGDFEKFLYVGQLLQAEAIGMALRTHRSQMPYCMGSLYWQLNDCWPVASWSGIDYYGRWKALHYFAREACRNQILNAVIENNKLIVYGISDLEGKTAAVLKLNLIDFNGLSLWNRPVKVNLPSNSAAVIYQIDLKDLPLKYRENEVVLTATLVKGQQEIDRQYVYFVEPADLKLPDPGLKTRISQKNGQFVIELSTQNLCKNLMLISDNSEVQFSDNFFDMLPGETRLVNCPATIRWEDFENGFRTLSLEQTMH